MARNLYYRISDFKLIAGQGYISAHQIVSIFRTHSWRSSGDESDNFNFPQSRDEMRLPLLPLGYYPFGITPSILGYFPIDKPWIGNSVPRIPANWVCSGPQLADIDAQHIQFVSSTNSAMSSLHRRVQFTYLVKLSAKLIPLNNCPNFPRRQRNLSNLGTYVRKQKYQWTLLVLTLLVISQLLSSKQVVGGRHNHGRCRPHTYMGTT